LQKPEDSPACGGIAQRRVKWNIALVAWFSDGAAHALGVDVACVQRARTDDDSNDNLFPTVLGLLGVATQDYDPQRDIFAGGRLPLTGDRQRRAKLVRRPGLSPASLPRKSSAGRLPAPAPASTGKSPATARSLDVAVLAH
jgi:hypothetical protein